MLRFFPAPVPHRSSAGRRATWLSVACVVLAGSCPFPATAEPATPGFVAGDEKPAGDDSAVRVPGGWMVAYDETIPGTTVTFRMLPVAGGTFRMGSPDGEEGRGPEEGPVHEVRVEPFWMGRCEVTWGEYKAYMAACDLFKAMESARINPVTAANEADAVTAPSNLYDPTTTFTHGEEPLFPAATMTQFAARQYTKWISGLSGRFHRLPTEAEWEYACRAGSATPFSAPEEELDQIAWHAGNADDTTHEVGAKKPNAWGFHDMHGNVGEWVLDELVPDGYARQAALEQPVAAGAAAVWPTHLSPRVVRGGSYYDEPQRCRSAARRGSEDTAWKEVDPNLPKSPWWYTEEPALGVGMRIVRPLAVPVAADQRRWWDADIESIRADTADRLLQGRGARGIVSPTLQDKLKAAGLAK